MLKTIILDCDGVMFQSLQANLNYYNRLLTEFGCPVMNDEELEFVHIHNVHDSVIHIFRNHPAVDLEEVHRYRQELSYLPFLKYMEMERDLPEFLETLQENYNLAIATNRTDTMEPLLDEFSLRRYFGKVMTASNSRKPKPAPDPLLEIIEHYGCSIRESVYVGDSIIDEETAKGCGMRFIAFKNNNLTANYHVESFTEILNLIPELH